jgi:DNA-binding NarL/FixJ family response regulator
MRPRGLTGEDSSVEPSVLIVDDHDDFRHSARRLLEVDGFVVVGEASLGAEVVDLTRALRPGIVLLDIQLPDMDGFVVAERLASLVDPPIVVLISSRDASAYQTRIATSPARAFIAKQDLSGAQLTAIVR